MNLAGESRHVEFGLRCTGCLSCRAACPQGAIESVRDAEGFWYPAVDMAACTACGRCVQACPLARRPMQSAAPTAFACRARQRSLRLASSSGGVFSLLAEKTLGEGGIVFGAALGPGLDVVHVGVEAEGRVPVLRRSKYVQSYTGAIFDMAKIALDSGRPVLFSGTPCQVAGIKAHFGCGCEHLTCVDFFCHGVPSPMVWRRYVEFQERRFGSRADEASFREKSAGWRRYSMYLHFENGRSYKQTHDRDPYLRAFLADICLRPSCHSCEFKGLPRMSDITLADFWGVEQVHPEMDDDSGTSLVLVNTETGAAAFSRIQPAIECERVSPERAVATNRAAVQSVIAHPGRGDFLKDIDTVRFDHLVRKYVDRSLLQKARARLLGLIRRWAHTASTE